MSTHRPVSAPAASRRSGGRAADARKHRQPNITEMIVDKPGNSTSPDNVMSIQPTHRPDSAPRFKRPGSASNLLQRKVAETVLPGAGLPEGHMSFFGPPLNSMSYTAGTITGPMAPLERERQRQARRELRLDPAKGCRQDIWGTDTWSSTSSEYGSLMPTLKGEPRKAFPAFLSMMLLPHHPHWKNRPDRAEAAKSFRSTYSDLGSFYNNTGRLPDEFLQGRAA